MRVTLFVTLFLLSAGVFVPAQVPTLQPMVTLNRPLANPFSRVTLGENVIAYVTPTIKGHRVRILDLKTGQESDFFPAERTLPVDQKLLIRFGPHNTRYLAVCSDGMCRIQIADSQGNKIGDVSIRGLMLAMDIGEDGTIYWLGYGYRKNRLTGFVHAVRDGVPLWDKAWPEGTARSEQTLLLSWYHLLVRGNRIYCIVRDVWSVFDLEGNFIGGGRFVLSSPNAGVEHADYIPGTGWLVTESGAPVQPGVSRVPDMALKLYLFPAGGGQNRVVPIPAGSVVLGLRDGRVLLDWNRRLVLSMTRFEKRFAGVP